MIKDKRKSLTKALQYSYQSAFIKKTCCGDCCPPVRGLINANRLTQDYDEKILSIGFEHGFQAGDIFEWVNTGTYWLIYL
uniref:Flagellar assembly protein T, C-terminal domain n=1 Tax=Siphoviridae sp. ctWhx86 TaxID=2826362 RepID=A0A8S5QNM7_9CAUD|nr:MAG TPA: Flagellar assembly protein T, C-terminal domain [Siphoviridae sp. ctWhx86]